MQVVKRNGQREPVQFDKIVERVRKLADGLPYCDPVVVAQKVVQGVHDGITTEALDGLAAETSAYLSGTHPDYGVLGARIAASNLHKRTDPSFSSTIEIPGMPISERTRDVVRKHAERIDAVLVHDRDFEFDYFGFKTLEKSYLLRVDDKIVERPQHMIMRVCIGIHGDDLESAFESYDLMSRRVFTHGTPTLFNAGTCRSQMSSCFLLRMKDDSIAGIYDTLKDCALISKHAGGIGLSAHNVRAKGSYVAGTNGNSNGIVPMLRVFDATARYVDQGGGKRKGSFAIYLEPWHADFEDFLLLKRNQGKAESRARDLFYAMWTPDLFMRRVEADAQWTLFCPHDAPGLDEVYGQAFDVLYERYEREGRGRKTMRAQELWYQILSSQIETGTPYMMYKDACNEKSNQKNLGTIGCSNLCCEIVQKSSAEEIAVCNLASINLQSFLRRNDGTYDYEELRRVSGIVVRNLNRIIDENYYPVPEAERSNLRHRPIALGVQGLADVFVRMRLPYESPEAGLVNARIFETIYFGAIQASNELAMMFGPYDTFEGSPASKGVLQHDMWNAKPDTFLAWDWTTLKASIALHGLRNSLTTAAMPTASTSQILGNTESFEPLTSNVYSRRVLAGDFYVVNKHLVRDLTALGLWTAEIRNRIVMDRGSVQGVKEIPDDLKSVYKTVWEIKQKRVIDMAAERAPWIDQSQSMNLHIANPTSQNLTSAHFRSWKLGLKTGMYYLRSKPKVDAIQFTVTKEVPSSVPEEEEDACVRRRS